MAFVMRPRGYKIRPNKSKRNCRAKKQVRENRREHLWVARIRSAR
jgi:hypothetical protein